LYEKDTNLLNRFLPQKNIAPKEALLQILSHLLGLYPAGDKKIRSTKGLILRFEKNIEVSAFFGWRI